MKKSPLRNRKSKSRSPLRRQKKSKSPLRRQSAQRIDTSHLKKHSLTKHGYGANKSLYERHRALDIAVEKYGPTVVWKKLNLISVLNKNRSPKTANIFTKDKNWLRLKYL